MSPHKERTNASIVFALVVAVAGCATGPRAPELVALDRLRAASEVLDASLRQRELVEESTDAYRRAVAAWKDGEPEEMRRWAQVAALRLRLAITRTAQDREPSRARELAQKLAGARARQAALAEVLARIEELIGLHEDLAVARVDALVKSQQLTEVQQRSEAQHAIDEAALAIKVAETVESQVHATQLHGLARSLLAKATAELGAGKAAEATARAATAKKTAEAALRTAHPLFVRHKEAAARMARDQDLQREAAAVASAVKGVSVRIVTVEQKPQLEIRLTFLYPAGIARPHPKKVKEIIEPLAAVLKKYPEYPVLIRGYTSHRTPREQRQALSQARAEALRQRFGVLGLPAARFVASGQAAKPLIGHAFNAINDRAELVLLLSRDAESSPPASRPASAGPAAVDEASPKSNESRGQTSNPGSADSAPPPTMTGDGKDGGRIDQIRQNAEQLQEGRSGTPWGPRGTANDVGSHMRCWCSPCEPPFSLLLLGSPALTTSPHVSIFEP